MLWFYVRRVLYMPSLRLRYLRSFGQIQLARHFERKMPQQTLPGAFLSIVQIQCTSVVTRNSLVILHWQQIKGYRSVFNAKSFRKCTHSERGGSHLEWTAFLRIFSVPTLWNFSPTAILMMPYSIHQESLSVLPSTPNCQSKKKYLFTESEIFKWFFKVI